MNFLFLAFEVNKIIKEFDHRELATIAAGNSNKAPNKSHGVSPRYDRSFA